MLEKIREYYELTRLDGHFEQDVESPKAWSFVYHKSYPRFNRTPLLQAELPDKSFRELLSVRASTRQFGRDPVTFAELSSLLRAVEIVDQNREPERRSYPSPGARFSTELYIANFNCEGIPKGWYHYDIKGRALEDLNQDIDRSIETSLTSPYVTGSSLAIVLTSLTSRLEVKYGYKAFPYSLIEAGHIGQNIVLSAAALGLGACPVGGFINEVIERSIDLSSEEIPVYVFGIGRRTDD